MRGLFKRKGSDVWQGRFRIPEKLWRQRDRLAELGVKNMGKAQEFGRSTGKTDRDEAGEVYRAMLVEWDARTGAWRTVLEEGPQALSHKQQVALAAEHAKAFLAAHEEDPFDAPPPPPIPEPPSAGNAAMVAMVDAMEEDKRADFERDLREYVKAGLRRKRSLTIRLLSLYPGLRSIIGKDVAAALEAIHGADSDGALAKRRLHVTEESRRLLNLQMATMMSAVHRGLEARRGGDYRPVAGLEAAPVFVASGSTSEPAMPGGVLTLEFLLDHKAKTTSIRPKTVSDNRSYLRKFVAFLGHNDARKVIKDDVRRWRDSLMETDLSPKTITDRYLSAVRAALAHGVKEFDLPLNAASGLADNRDSAAPQGSRGYSEAEAVKILNATFNGSSKALSAPHRRALFWVPWVLAYTGLRVSEVTQLQGKRLMEESGIPYLLITPEDGSTKSGKAWAVGVHTHLIELGLLEMLKANGPGPVFYEPYPKGTDLTAIEGKHRALEAGGRVADWIKNEVGIKAPLGRPNHAWRHLFTTRSRSCGMDKEARDFMMGSRSGTDAREGYGDWPPAVLGREINKLPRFAVKDAEWRP